ncbi:MAG: hypothetical protein WCE69_13685 [Aestuariivirga sp.]
MMLTVESQQVIWLRSMKLAAGGTKAEKEARLMVSEKMLMASLEGGRLLMGATSANVVKRYRSKVRANVKRLSR